MSDFDDGGQAFPTELVFPDGGVLRQCGGAGMVFIPFSSDDWRRHEPENLTAAVFVCGEVFLADAHDMAMSNALEKFGDEADREMEWRPDEAMGYAVLINVADGAG